MLLALLLDGTVDRPAFIVAVVYSFVAPVWSPCHTLPIKYRSRNEPGKIRNKD